MSNKANATGAGCPDGNQFRLVLPLGGRPKVARLHHIESPCLNPGEAAGQFLEAVQTLGSQELTPLLLAGAGFGGARLSAPTEKKIPSEAEFGNCLEAARQWAEAFSLNAHDLGLHALFGLDIFAASKRAPGEFAAVAQFVVHFDTSVHKASLVAAKRLPTSVETGYLYCGEQPEGLPAILDLPGLGATLPLVCHDLNVANHRALKTQTPGGVQAWRRGSIEKDLSRRGLETAFGAIHSLWLSAPTFKISMKQLHDAHPGVNAIAAFGTYKDSLANVLVIAERHTPSGLLTAELVPANWPKD